MASFMPAQVLERIPGLTMRELIDMNEKNVISPAVDANGQGSSRKYNDENLFQIAVAGALRKILPPSVLKIFMSDGYEAMKNCEKLIINLYPDEKKKILPFVVKGTYLDKKKQSISYGYGIDEPIKKMRDSQEANSIKDFVSIILNLEGIRKYLELKEKIRSENEAAFANRIMRKRKNSDNYENSDTYIPAKSVMNSD
jgi:hypothetical protein